MCMDAFEGYRCTLYVISHGPVHQAWDIDGVLCAEWPLLAEEAK